MRRLAGKTVTGGILNAAAAVGGVADNQAAIADAGFEQVAVGAGKFRYDPTGSPWTFAGNAGLSANGSGFTCRQPAGAAGRPGRLPPGDRLDSARRSPAGRPAPTC